MTPTSPVNAIIPLAILEAIRNLDTPLDDGLPAELPHEAFAKRLGLSTTVAAQIERYRDMAGRGAPIERQEAMQVFRLAGRRSDAGLVYEDAGRRAARVAARKRGGRPSVFWRLLGSSARRKAGERAAGRALQRLFGLEVTRGPGGFAMTANDSLAAAAGFEGPGCQFYGALGAELLRLATGFEGSMVHETCLARGEGRCAWRAVDPDQRW